VLFSHSDCGESFGSYILGDDEGMMSYVDRANVAAQGGHSSDPQVMDRTVALAKAKGVLVGVHPGYPGE
jgi:UPF0271 protein